MGTLNGYSTLARVSTPNGFLVAGNFQAGAFRWTPAGGYSGLGGFSGGGLPTVTGMSADGTVIVGTGNGSGGRAFFWTPTTGMLDFREYLRRRVGHHLNQVQLLSASGVSADGLTIVGTSWIAKIENPNVATAAGTIHFSGLAPGTAEPRTVEFNFRNEDGTLVKSTLAYLDPASKFWINCPELPGLYDLTIKLQPWLRRTIRINTHSGEVTDLSFNLVSGDIDGDNEISIGDYSILSIAFGSWFGGPSWRIDADLNRDDYVDIADYAILSANCGLIGDA